MADALAGATASCVKNIAITEEMEIEIMYPDKEYDFDEDVPEFGTVRRFNSEIGEFENGFDKKEGSLWLENL